MGKGRYNSKDRRAKKESVAQMDKRISAAVIRRMPKYYRHLSDLEAAEVVRISSGALAERLGLTASQVRQDFNCFGGFGQQGYGYNVKELRESISKILKIDRTRKAIIIGAGNLGRALLSNFKFEKYGIELVAAFDTSPQLVGTKMADVAVHDYHDIEAFMKQECPDIAILTLPREAAPGCAQKLIACGIRGIWNFTNIDLHLDVPDVPVENVNFSESLMVLSYRL